MGIKKYIIVLSFVSFSFLGFAQITSAFCSLQNLKECDRAGLISILTELIKYKQLNNKADLARFNATEIISNNLPESIEFWVQAYCPNSGTDYDYKYDMSNYLLEKCEKGEVGSHGGCSTCGMSLITLKKDFNVEIINSFFDYLNDKKYKEAYKIYDDSDNLGYDFFQGKYRFFDMKINSISKIDNNKYKFKIVDSYIDESGVYMIHELIALIVNNKISIIDPGLKSIEEIDVNGKKVIIKQSTFQNMLVFEDKDGKEHIIDSFLNDADVIKRTKLKNLSISNTGKYISYEYVGWECVIYIIYDIEEKKEIYHSTDAYIVKFSNDDKYFLACGDLGISSIPFTSIIELKNNKEIYFNSDMSAAQCAYDKGNNMFILVSYKNGVRKIVKFNASTGEIKE